MARQLIKLGHSPDSDDAFMFYGLACGAVDTGRFEFEHILRDIETLNEWARQKKLEVTAVSVHAYAYLYDSYALLSSGASMGGTELVTYEADDGVRHLHPPAKAGGSKSPKAVTDGTGAHGPLVVAAKEMSLTQLSGKTIAIPGLMTTAFLTLQLALGKVEYVVMPFDKILPAVQAGEIEAGVIIHEGQLTYERFGLHCVLDLGRWWYEQTGLTLPLGCNIIRRDLGTDAIGEISGILRSSIDYGLDHRQAAVEYARQYGGDLDISLTDKFVGMYVNDWTRDYGPLGRRAVTELLKRGHEADLIPATGALEFV